MVLLVLIKFVVDRLEKFELLVICILLLFIIYLFLQLWSQNMQDLGVCEELVCEDDFNIPDVDLTFRNFEELFDQDPIRALLDDKEVSFSSMEKDLSLDNLDNPHSRTMEV